MGVSMTFPSVGDNAIYQRKYAHGQTYGGLPCCICYCAVDYLTQHLGHLDYLAHVHIHTSTHKHTHKYTQCYYHTQTHTNKQHNFNQIQTFQTTPFTHKTVKHTLLRTNKQHKSLSVNAIQQHESFQVL